MSLSKRLDKLVLEERSRLGSAKVTYDPTILPQPRLNQRELLIGLLLLQGKTQAQIAEHFAISKSRLGQILARLCRYKFGVSGGGACYRQLLIDSGCYQQIPREILVRYLS